jgi:hypothetical protein
MSGFINYAIRMDELPDGPVSRALALSADTTTALARAIDGDVTYVYAENGALVACIAPPEAGERYEHASEVLAQPREHEATIPVLVSAGRPRRRRSWLGPLEGIF